jgi:predicted Co/Zn/Cd cation transporter (cation efflux family)
VSDRDSLRDLLVTGAFCVLIYLLVAGRLLWRIFSSGVNASARSFLLGIVISSAALVAVGIAMAYANRKKPEAWVAVAIASFMGILMCLLFFGA